MYQFRNIDQSDQSERFFFIDFYNNTIRQPDSYNYIFNIAVALLNRIWPHCGQDASSVKSSQAWHLCGCFNARKTSGNELQALGLRFHFLWFVPAFLFEARLDSTVHSDRLCPNHTHCMYYNLLSLKAFVFKPI